MSSDRLALARLADSAVPLGGSHAVPPFRDRSVDSRPATLLFADIEGSTSVLSRLGDEPYGDWLSTHRVLMGAAIAAHGGAVVGTEGDGTFAVFGAAINAVLAAIDTQLALARHRWPDDAPCRVRIGVHTGDVVTVDGNYVGIAVHTAARIMAAGHGQQLLVSDVTRLELRALPEDGATRVETERTFVEWAAEAEADNQAEPNSHRRPRCRPGWRHLAATDHALRGKS